MIAFANLISSRIIWRPRNDGWLCAHAPGSKAEPAWTGLGGQDPPLPLGGLSHPHLGGQARQPGPLLVFPLGAGLLASHLDGRAWKSPPGTTPALVWPGSRSPGTHVSGVDAGSFLAFSRKKGSGMDWEWFSQGLLIPLSDS